MAAGLYWYYATAHGVVLLPHVAMIYCMHTGEEEDQASTASASPGADWGAPR